MANEAARIKKELKAAGAKGSVIIKTGGSYLLSMLDQDEHIVVAVSGRYHAGEDTRFLTMDTGMLVATEQRIIFLDHKLGFNASSEWTYGGIGGISRVSGGPLSALTLVTRSGNYTLSYVNNSAAANFAKYIDKRIVENTPYMPLPNTTQSR